MNKKTWVLIGILGGLFLVTGAFSAGAIVEDIPAVLAAVGQGANFRQVHKAGVRLITQLVA